MPRRPHLPLKQFTFPSDTASRLRQISTLCCIVATLVVVGALLFSAGSAWAHWNDGLAAHKRRDLCIDISGG